VADRIHQLNARVRWFDRYRRFLSIATAVVIAPILIAEINVVLGAQWPLIHGAAMSVMLGVAVWWVAEVCLAWMIAIWETESDNLARATGLPRAEIYQRRK